jgi:Rho-binding antiterminator
MSAADPYQPIPCVQHERLEFAALRRIPVHLTFDDGGERKDALVQVLDVFTRDGAEWLRCVDTGNNEALIRLDRIVDFQERPR